MKKLITLIFTAVLCSNAFASGHVVSVSGTNATCNGMCNGSAVASVTGGVGPFQYTWSDGQNVSTATALCAATFTVTVTDLNDMSTATAVVSITEPAPVVISAPSTYYVCSGDAVTLSVTGGVTYSWSPATGLSSSSGPSPVSAPTATTTYTVTASNMSGCYGTATTTVNVLAAVYSTVTTTPESSCGACDGTATVMPTGGTAPYSYNWGSGASGIATISGLCPGSYTVVTTDPNGCTATSVAYVSSPQPDANFSIVPDSADGNSILAFNTSTLAAYYFWDFGDGNVSTSASPVHTYAAPGTYTICLQAVGAGSCGDTVCQSVTITGTPASCLALFNIADDTTSANPNAYTIYNLSYGASLSYFWDFGDGGFLGTSTLAHPTHVYGSPGPFQICLTVDNGSGCVQTYCDSIYSADSLGRSSDPISFTVVDGTPASVVTGITEHASKASASVSPNPFNETATVMIQSDKANETYTFEMTDVLGKTVRSVSGITEKQFDVSRAGLENGMYFYKIYTAGTVIGTGKLIIK